jgi:hypothetical protein
MTVPEKGPHERDLLELTKVTLQWLEEYYPEKFNVTCCVRQSNSSFDTIGIGNKWDTRLGYDGFVNICENRAYFFRRKGHLADCHVLAADKQYFDMINKYAELWLAK